MAIQKLDKSTWQPFLNRLAHGLVGKRAEVEVAALQLGDQIAAERLPLLGIAYDPKNDLIEVALDAVDHLIHHPREVFADLGDTGVSTIEIIDGDNVHHIVKLSDPLMLPTATR
jgi:Family of unknown function (DUF5335)